MLTAVVGKLRVGADMGSVGSREGEGGEQSEHACGEACRECGGFSECIVT